MTTTSSHQNGHPRPSARPEEVLPFLATDENSFRRFAVNCAFTLCHTTEQDDLARTLLGEIVHAVRGQAANERLDLDALSVEAIAQVAEQRLHGLPEIAELEESDHSTKLGALRDLQARRPTRLVRLVQQVTAEVSAAATAALRTAAQELLGRCPLTCSNALDSLERELKDFHIPPQDSGACRRFQSGVKSCDAITRLSMLSPKVRLLLEQPLRKRCDDLFLQAIHSLYHDFAAESLRQTIAALLPVLEELRRGQVTYRRAIDAVSELLERRSILARQRSIQGRSSVVLQLATPGSDQLLTGIRDRLRCSDRAELVRLVMEKLIFSLNEVARTRFLYIQTPATLTTLLIQMSAPAVTETLVDTVQDLVGDIHTVYTAARGVGIREVVRELYERAAPLCQLTSRDHVRLNVETHSDVVVRMPRPRSMEDAEIAQQLRDAFREYHKTTQFLEDEHDTEITVVRTLIGFPIGIEAANESMLIDYAASASQGHRPHLVGLLPETPTGLPIPELLALARHRH